MQLHRAVKRKTCKMAWVTSSAQCYIADIGCPRMDSANSLRVCLTLKDFGPLWSPTVGHEFRRKCFDPFTLRLGGLRPALGSLLATSYNYRFSLKPWPRLQAMAFAAWFAVWEPRGRKGARMGQPGGWTLSGFCVACKRACPSVLLGSCTSNIVLPFRFRAHLRPCCHRRRLVCM